MKNLKTYIVEAIKPPRLSTKNKHLWKNGLVDEEKIMDWIEENCAVGGRVDIVIGKINVDGDIEIKNIDIEIIPYPFGEVIGCFDCTECEKLKSLKNSPQKVGDYFNCSGCNNLTSLEGAPKEVGGNFHCYDCENLISLEGAPEEVGGIFDCSDCKNLKSLKNSPREVDGAFWCNDCGKQFTEDDVKKVCKVKGDICV